MAGQRDALAAILLEATGTLPGCLSYVIATDPADPDALWITGVWDGAASHTASLSLPAGAGRDRQWKPLIAGFSKRSRHHLRGFRLQPEGLRAALEG